MQKIRAAGTMYAVEYRPTDGINKRSGLSDRIFE